MVIAMLVSFGCHRCFDYGKEGKFVTLRPQPAEPAGCIRFATVCDRRCRPLPRVYRRRFFRLGRDEAVGQLQVRQHRTEERNRVAMLDQQGREIFHVEITHHIGLVFDIDPDETFVGVTCRQRLEVVAVLGAGAAPCGAQAGDYPRIAFQPFGKFSAVF
jgi:hypothetical protein